ncbi:MAG: quinolinate synthase NadA [Candidatus Cloacimonadaceae bacterium]|jgi:quinolinate synthase|nr:quinolinate synthase NadA [Candidatus Cloacimonadaceae bacterium]
MKDTIAKIKALKNSKNALILAHNYQAVEIQELADFRGDSLQLAMLSARLDNPIIVFCGVRFMAETAAILNPASKVLLPVKDAGCPMADMITGAQLREFKQAYPGSAVVCYVNSTVEVKAESDICCTSSNAVKIIKSLPIDQTVLFVPDRNLGSWAGRQSGRKVITWDGYCPTHQWGFTPKDVVNMRNEYPDYTLLAHPECDRTIVDKADEVMSTGGMMKYVENHDKVIIATETGLTEYLQHLYPEKSIVSLSPKAVCPNMKKTHLEDVLAALQHEQHHIQVPEDIAIKAKVSIDRMLELS